jgi:uracil-DNA glycosylase family 4
MQGFFTAGQLQAVSKPKPGRPQCGACGLYKGCTSPKIATSGQGDRRILLVVDGPTGNDDKNGKMLSGDTGNRLRKTLADIGVDVEQDCWVEGAIICHAKGGNPTTAQLSNCLPNLLSTIDRCKPDVIIPLGIYATTAVMLPAYKVAGDNMTMWAGWQIPSQYYNSWVCPTYSPVMMATNDYSGKNTNVADIWWRRHLEDACDLSGKPWPDGPPDYTKQVEIIYDTDKAARLIEQMTDRLVATQSLSAFDYECNSLKPENTGAKIYSCAISGAGRTIAFLWREGLTKAFRRYLRSDCPKVASNLKYEERWSRRHVGTPVRGWVCDTMLAAHLLDNRSGITGLKFQAAVMLGQAVYNEHIEGYFQNTGPNGLNKIHELAVSDLLLYNGLDALLELKLAKKQMKTLRCELN